MNAATANRMFDEAFKAKLDNAPNANELLEAAAKAYEECGLPADAQDVRELIKGQTA